MLDADALENSYEAEMVNAAAAFQSDVQGLLNALNEVTRVHQVSLSERGLPMLANVLLRDVPPFWQQLMGIRYVLTAREKRSASEQDLVYHQACIQLLTLEPVTNRPRPYLTFVLRPKSTPAPRELRIRPISQEIDGLDEILELTGHASPLLRPAVALLGYYTLARLNETIEPVERRGDRYIYRIETADYNVILVVNLQNLIEMHRELSAAEVSYGVTMH